MKRYLFPAFLLLALLSFSGCSNEQKPADLPTLHPVELTVIQDGKPLEGATVLLMPTGTSTRFSSSAVTDKSGVAAIKTDAKYPGAPEGKYKVCISKVVAPSAAHVDNSLSYEEQQSKIAESAKQTKSVVDSKFLKFGTTTFSIDVTSTGVKETLDVGAAVDDLWDKVTGSSSNSR